MAYVAPNSVVEFFSNIGLNDNYDDTLYFASTSAKDSYFAGLTNKIATATALTYNREQRGFIRVELPMSTLISASYMRFKNTSFENKWFYAFVKNVEYINNNCTQVNFAIDPLMTWMGTFTLNQCYIERQHTIHDYIGSNIADEGLDTGDYIVEYRAQTNLLTPWAICVFTAQNPNGQPAAGNIYSGVYSGCQLYVYANTYDGAERANALLAEITEMGGADSIACIIMLPYAYAMAAIDGSSAPSTIDIPIAKPYSDIAGYRPKNKKLFTYPYKCLSVYNSEGNSIDYKYEYFNTLPDQQSTGVCNFRLRTLISSNPLIGLFPLNYKGQDVAYDEQLNMKHFTTCSYAIDSWKAYYAMNKSTIDYDKTSAPWLGLAGMISGLAGAALGVGTPYAGSAIVSGANQIISSADSVGRTMAKHADYERMPNVSKGVANNDLMTADQTKDFYFESKCITKNYAMMIDDYFTMFGYAIKQVAVPNMNARPYYTYVKTIGCSVDGAIPADDARAIENIFNNGVRFWKNHVNIGNYSLDNSPT